MITLQDYFNDKPYTAEYNLNALTLLYRVNDLIAAFVTDTRTILQNNPATGNQISGNKNGDGGSDCRPPLQDRLSPRTR